MTERKPPGVTFETWTDKLVRLAIERGEFDNLSSRQADPGHRQTVRRDVVG